jgi:hypothetical protein
VKDDISGESSTINHGTICFIEGEQIINFFSTGADSKSPETQEYEGDVIEDQFAPEEFDIDQQEHKIKMTQTEFSNEESHNIFDDEVKEPIKDKVKIEASERKMADDSIRKKIKVRTCEALIKMANKQLFKLFGNQKIKFNKLPQNFIKNINIKENKQALYMTMEELFLQPHGEPGNKKYLNNINVIKKIKENFILKNNCQFLRYTLKEVLELYFNSRMFEEDLEKIKKAENEEYVHKFLEISKGIKGKKYSYLEYFEKIIPNKNPLKYPFKN